MADLAKLDRAFNPKCVVVVGDKNASGYMWLKGMIHVSDYGGQLYSVQVDPNELPGIAALGVRNYASLLEVPGEVDYVLCAVPRKVAPRIVQDCIKKGVGAVCLFTSGFAETDEEGIQLQRQIAQMAQAAGLNLIGPNCMGIHSPRWGVRHSVDQAHGEAGNVGFISQSGTHNGAFSTVGWMHGVKVSKAVSFGNAAVLDVADYLEYMAQDRETKVIAMYVEGVKKGRRFFEVLKQVTQHKPVVIWKGGQTADGARASASHTGSLAASQVIWDTLIRQCGAIKADNLDETVDMCKGLLNIKAGTGERMGVIAMTGGQSVVVSDAFAKAGLKVGPLSHKSYSEMASFFNVIGGSYRNPLDVSWNFSSPELAKRLLNILGDDEQVDAVALELGVGFMRRRARDNPGVVEAMLDVISEFKEQSLKPFFTMLLPGTLEAETLEVRGKLIGRGIASYPSFERGALAFKRLAGYYRFLNGG